MKKILMLPLVLVALLSMVACGGNEDSSMNIENQDSSAGSEGSLVVETQYLEAIEALEELDDEALIAEKTTELLSLWRESQRETISAGTSHTVAVKSDGTVVATGDNEYGQCDVSDWTDIVAVAAGEKHTLGLKSDGTVVATGDNTDGQCDVSLWHDVATISADGYSSALLLDGGHEITAPCSSLRELVAVDAGELHIVCLWKGGTTGGHETISYLQFSGANDHGQLDVGEWYNISAVSAGGFHSVGLTFDGKVYAAGDNQHGQCNVADWSDIKAISAGWYHTVGLKSDGTVIATVPDSYDEIYNYGQSDVSSWANITEISAGDKHTVGLTADGTVVATGDNEYGQCDVSDWTDIMVYEN